MINHHQDIDDGLEEFAEQQWRERLEVEFRHRPASLNCYVEDETFTAHKVSRLVLIGHRTEERDSPFSYEQGEAIVEATYLGKRSMHRLRWSDNGVDVLVQALTQSGK